MGTVEFDDLVARLRGIADVVNAFKAESVQLRVVEALISAHGDVSGTTASTLGADGQSTSATLRRARKATARKKAASAKVIVGEKATSRRRGTGASAFNLVNDINLAPAGKEPFDDFITRAQPKNHVENCLATVYWLVEIAKAPASDDRIFTVYRLQGWKLPANLTIELSRPKSLDWINPSDRKDIKVTVVGINHVEKTMLNRPPKVAI